LDKSFLEEVEIAAEGLDLEAGVEAAKGSANISSLKSASTDLLVLLALGLLEGAPAPVVIELATAPADDDEVRLLTEAELMVD